MRSDGGVDDGVGWHTGEFPVPDEWRLVGCWEHFVFRSDGGVDDMVGWHTGEFPVPDDCSLVGCWEHFVLVLFRLHGFRV